MTASTLYDFTTIAKHERRSESIYMGIEHRYCTGIASLASELGLANDALYGGPSITEYRDLLGHLRTIIAPQ